MDDEAVHDAKHGEDETIEYFKQMLYTMQKARVRIVQQLTKGGNADPEEVDLVRRSLNFLEDSRTGADNQRLMSTAGQSFAVNVKDEIINLRKDVDLLDRLQEKAPLDVLSLFSAADLPQILARYHPAGEAAFNAEVEATLALLNHLLNDTSSSLKPIFITDWDGTMKSYTSQYATNLQPVYSAIGMVEFARSFTRLSAVLTAGPLRGPGILDLTALPIDGPIVFSGSWGREWHIGGKRILYDDGIDEDGFSALERMDDEMKELLSHSDYSQFALVGSGFQKKVDRITLGIQTVLHQVNDDLSIRYQDAVKERMYRVDPNQQTLVFDQGKLEVEVCTHNSGSVWDKGNGVDRLLNATNHSIDKGRALIAGDTSSDLPMLRYALQRNPEGTFALFVGLSEELANEVRKMVGDERRVCTISTPDVFHAAVSKLIVSRADLD